MKKIIIFPITLFTLLCSFNIAYAQERITLSTFYPAPYGEYQELRSRRLAVGNAAGNNYSDPALFGWLGSGAGTIIPDNTDLIVAGRIGMGIINPQDRLELRGIAGGDTNNNIRLTTTAATSSIIGHDNRGAAVTDDGPYIQVLNNADRWSVRNAGSPGTQIITVDPQNLRLGVGTTAPESSLHVNAGSLLVSQAQATSAGISLRSGTAATGAPAVSTLNYTYNNVPNTDRFFITTWGIERLCVMRSTGNIGIGFGTLTGTTYPTSALHVRGGPINAEGGLIMQTVNPGPPAGTVEVGRMWIDTSVNPT